MLAVLRRHRPAPRLRTPFDAPALLVAIVLAVAACTTGSATPATSILASPTGSLAPGETGGPTAAPQPTFPLTVTDDEGTAVALRAVPRRIVSLTPGTTEIAFALGVGSRVVGVTNSDDYPPAGVKALPKVATFQGADIEKIVGLEPDIVLAGGNGLNKPTDLQKLRDLGIPVLVVYAEDVPGVLADVRLVGTALGEGPRANQLAAAMAGRIDTISQAASMGGKPRVFYELDATSQIFGPAPESFVAAMITLAGGDPVTSGDPKVFSISLEKLVAADPQVIVLGDANYGTTAAQVVKRPGWEGMTAIKDGAIRPVDDTVVTRPGPRLADGLRDLALAIHPDLQLPAGAALPSWTGPLAP